MVIPAFNEEHSIGRVLAELMRIKEEIPPMEIIVVDDGSSDGTVEEVSKYSSVNLILHSKNMGKGAALKTGFREVRGRVAVIQDADMEYFPGEIPHVIKPILNGEADVVYGTRFKSKPYGMTISHFLGNIILSKATTLLYRKNITDVMTGCKAFSRDVLDYLKLNTNGFSVEVELTSQVLQEAWEFLEVPINYAYRSRGSSKIRNIDGLNSLLRLFAKFIE